ncbi:hypothetical protein A2331_05470 [Candidatus Falkowbacteria bacterium RIFOXYB2_FULL_34_18]|uniref:Uncharacterized protein n=1 Tax=Candidatus Falkowbacteria bacterium RIFOXYD2_FULL_34_120 TaxID=1798007 RepID=A0A1F5TQU4_9BACT|nr:MAG: hypothetical protein A2331_05470 [Candidatus Falkowbacteria bacterium RIFOXYB2_FULL_34_18]OGF29842.1 MAG: hypothetical protein A2500_01560 [Candidatus Falkowbacteria bacterium RIFOXYC12_FULL_34_55]OGF37043.1 MAG: hypothetical protein A2466_05645 [Candidatus Falkowbacteria bacterium RIFOXYC2_FULL_34_220]OGF39235.1 MAG: hypothetical protein A2515_00855 [Candidatus Falkowbacteria bacterium RIFOXYD12_FULL_34_57]OGF41340.1 MAG: hypothetical protein A2531_07065 [Candidatus Falkowbacteria bact
MYQVFIGFKKIGEFKNFGEAVAFFVKKGKKITGEQELRNLYSTGTIEWEGRTSFYTNGFFTSTRAFEFEQIINLALILDITDDNGELTGNVPEVGDVVVEEDFFKPSRYMDRGEWNKYLQKLKERLES